jgi:hypothetical protein
MTHNITWDKWYTVDDHGCCEKDDLFVIFAIFYTEVSSKS